MPKLTQMLENINVALSIPARDLKLVVVFGEALFKMIEGSQENQCNVRVDEHSGLSLLARANYGERMEENGFGLSNPRSNLLEEDEKSTLFYLIGKAYYESNADLSQNYKLSTRYMTSAFLQGKRAAAHYLGLMSYYGQGVQQSYKKAFDYFVVGSGAGNVDSIKMLSCCYWFGNGISINYGTSRECTDLALELGSAVAMRDKAYGLLYGPPGVNQDWPQAVKLLKLARVGGSLYANMELGRCYEHGVGFTRDPAKAFECYKTAFLSGVQVAATCLARCFEEGIGVQKDLVQAAELHQKAFMAQKGIGYGEDFRQCSHYGLCLVRGLGVEKNHRLGMQYIQKGLYENHGVGWSVIAKCYRYGYGVEVDMGKAVSYYVRGAECTDGSDGILACNFALAEMYEKGEGLALNINKAAYYYQVAANKMHPTAQWKTALFYESGKAGFEVNVYRSLDFFEKAARNGHALAIRKVGEIYMKGVGVQRDRATGKSYLDGPIDRDDLLEAN